MIVYKIVDEYCKNTGEKLGKRKTYLKTICDFTGEDIEDGTNPYSYIVNYNDNDPNFGDAFGEGWFYKTKESDDCIIDSYDLFGCSNYIFTTDWGGKEIFNTVIEEFKKTGEPIYGLSSILRWSRGQMLKKVILDGTYKMEAFFK